MYETAQNSDARAAFFSDSNGALRSMVGGSNFRLLDGEVVKSITRRVQEEELRLGSTLGYPVHRHGFKIKDLGCMQDSGGPTATRPPANSAVPSPDFAISILCRRCDQQIFQACCRRKGRNVRLSHQSRIRERWTCSIERIGSEDVRKGGMILPPPPPLEVQSNADLRGGDRQLQHHKRHLSKRWTMRRWNRFYMAAGQRQASGKAA